MILYCTADIHGYLPEIPECDILLISGDIIDAFSIKFHHMKNWMETEVKDWLDRIPAKRVVFTPGNHDYIYHSSHKEHFPKLRWDVLIDSSIIIEGIKIYGTPWTETFHDWAFNAPIEDLPIIWNKIPKDTDILLCHMPPQGAAKGGNKELREKIDEIGPKLVVCGHYHTGFGEYVRPNGTLILNAALIGKSRLPENRPVRVNYESLPRFTPKPIKNKKKS